MLRLACNCALRRTGASARSPARSTSGRSARNAERRWRDSQARSFLVLCWCWLVPTSPIASLRNLIAGGYSPPMRQQPAGYLAGALFVALVDYLIRGGRRRREIALEINPASGLRLSPLEIFAQRKLQPFPAWILGCLSDRPPAALPVLFHRRPASRAIKYPDANVRIGQPGAQIAAGSASTGPFPCLRAPRPCGKDRPPCGASFRPIL